MELVCITLGILYLCGLKVGTTLAISAIGESVLVIIKVLLEKKT